MSIDSRFKKITFYCMKIKTLLIIVFIILIPFILNLWNGYLKPAQSGKIEHVDCSTISNNLNPYVNDIIKLIQEHGNKTSAGPVEGYKLVRSTVKEKLPQVYNIIEEYVSKLNVDGLKPANCEREQYCWFLRLYNQKGHYIDWHFDNNFTNGLRKTYVCNVYISECNTSHLMTKDRYKMIRVDESRAGKGVVYNGSEVKHSVSRQNDGCIRISLIIPLYEDDSVSILGWFRRGARNISDKIFKL
jgi:hypothetical protein